MHHQSINQSINQSIMGVRLHKSDQQLTIKNEGVRGKSTV